MSPGYPTPQSIGSKDLSRFRLPPEPGSTTPNQASVIAAFLASSILLSLWGSAQATPPYAYTLTGDRFVRMMNGAEPLNGNDYMLREKAYSYLDGVRDSAEGRDWCDVNQLKTPDLAYELAADIAGLPPAERKRNASILLIELLHRKFPCPAKGGKS